MILSDPPVIPSAILEICRHVVDSCGFSLVEVRTQGKLRNLQVTLFHPQKDLSLDDCEQVSRKLYGQLEALKPTYFDPALVIEVQSPGTDRRLKSSRDFEVFTGRIIELTLASKLFDLTNCFICRLAEFDGKSITVDKLMPHTSTERKQSVRGTTSVLPNRLTLDLEQVNTVRLSEIALIDSVEAA